jgi:hypothetical protein
MQIMRGTIYRDYTVLVNPAGTPEGRFRDAFSVHKHAEGSPDLRSTVFQRSVSVASIFQTEHEASESATKIAEAWVDAQYD